MASKLQRLLSSLLESPMPKLGFHNDHQSPVMFASKRNLSSSTPQQPSEKSKVDSPLSPPLSNDGGVGLDEDRTKEGEDGGEDDSGIFINRATWGRGQLDLGIGIFISELLVDELSSQSQVICLNLQQDEQVDSSSSDSSYTHPEQNVTEKVVKNIS
ncbi:uncharacterized protein A4U43_C09F15830 [Asparagus officinalis]|uniref:Uncharacterized protein n=1 Tax=Asparagus officinalis TaxID=4686 RepID=A0A5P1ECQ6_ASPOF|nr:uncharacterized protein A4U43_C09F15830 [Asparagus officinalis]